MASDITLKTDSEPAAVGPAKSQSRIVSLDVLRGFSLLGILVMNIQSFSMIDAAYFNPTAFGSLEGANGWVWYGCYLLADMKFMNLFSMLFGAGIIMMTQKPNPSGTSARTLHYRRMFTLLLIGLAHAYLLWTGDILVAYAICGSFVFLVAKLDTKWLATLGVLCVLIGMAIWSLLGLAVLIVPESILAELQESDWQPSLAAIQVELDAFRGTWMEQQKWRRYRLFKCISLAFPSYFGASAD